jgi:hypothetical protein
VLLIEFAAKLLNAFTASLPETTGSFIRLQPQSPLRVFSEALARRASLGDARHLGQPFGVLQGTWSR